jgi:hypothetical protein
LIDIGGKLIYRLNCVEKGDNIRLFSTNLQLSEVAGGLLFPLYTHNLLEVKAKLFCPNPAPGKKSNNVEVLVEKLYE